MSSSPEPELDVPVDDEAGELLLKLRTLLRRHRRLFSTVKESLIYMSQEIDDLIAAIDADITVSDGIITLCDKLTELLKDPNFDRQKALAKIAEIKAASGRTADAILRNTPQAPPPGGAAPGATGTPRATRPGP